ncbi:hypothetical protein LguiB_031904 [Lonicera macranthoides]
MGDSSSSSSSFFRRHWEGYKEFWSERFSILDNYSRFIKQRDNPIPSWSDSDVDAFIAVDPVHGNAVSPLPLSLSLYLYIHIYSIYIQSFSFAIPVFIDFIFLLVLRVDEFSL